MHTLTTVDLGTTPGSDAATDVQGVDLGQGRSFAEVWCDRVQATPQATFLVFNDEAGNVDSWTYAEFDASVQHAMQVMSAHGVGAGDAVHLALRNSPAFLAFWLGCARLGAWMVPVDPASGERDLQRQLERVAPRLGVHATTRRAPYLAAAAGAGLVTLLEVDETAADLDLLASRAAALPPLPALDAPAPADRLAVMFTSGTTSQPKGVVLTHANYVTLARTMSAAAGLQARHRWFVALPLFHANAQYYCFAPAIAVGASVALSAGFSASRWVSQAHDLGATHASLFAAPIRMILARTPADAPQLALEHVWFAQSLGQEHHRQFARLAGVAPRQLYGMTETVAIVTADDSAPPVHDVIGRPVADRQVRLADVESGAEITAPGTPGMIQVAGTRGVDLFAEYLDDPATTARSFLGPAGAGDRVWFATGDLATRDADGLLRFVGRADDVIKVSGENVSLTEVEAVLAQAPGVLEAAVLSQPDPVRDVVPVAYVVPRDPSSPPSVDVLAAWAERELTPAARPRAWHLIDELPRTSVGKVRRFAVATGAAALS